MKTGAVIFAHNNKGIDYIKLAIFCASTGNPRQFIQRRGRVLRLAKGKDEAVIYDLVVVPDPSGESDLFNLDYEDVINSDELIVTL